MKQHKNVLSDQGIFANKFHGKMKQNAFNIFGFKTLFQGASARRESGICFSKIHPRPADRERGVLESLEHTVFPKLLRTVETEVLVNDDVTVSDQTGGIRMFHCHLVSLVSVKCLSLLLYDLIRVGLLGRLKGVSREVTEHLGRSELDHYVKVLDDTMLSTKPRF